MKNLTLKEVKSLFPSIHEVVKGRGFDLRSSKILTSEVRDLNNQIVEPEFYVLCKDGILYHLVSILGFHITEEINDPTLKEIAQKAVMSYKKKKTTKNLAA